MATIIPRAWAGKQAKFRPVVANTPWPLFIDPAQPWTNDPLQQTDRAGSRTPNCKPDKRFNDRGTSQARNLRSPRAKDFRCFSCVRVKCRRVRWEIATLLRHRQHAASSLLQLCCTDTQIRKYKKSTDPVNQRDYATIHAAKCGLIVLLLTNRSTPTNLDVASVGVAFSVYLFFFSRLNEEQLARLERASGLLFFLLRNRLNSWKTDARRQSQYLMTYPTWKRTSTSTHGVTIQYILFSEYTRLEVLPHKPLRLMPRTIYILRNCLIKVLQKHGQPRNWTQLIHWREPTWFHKYAEWGLVEGTLSRELLRLTSSVSHPLPALLILHAALSGFVTVSYCERAMQCSVCFSGRLV